MPTLHGMRAPLLLLALFATTRADAQAQQPAADSAAIAAEVLALNAKYVAAAAAHNTAVIDSLIAPDGRTIRPNGDRHSKQDMLATMTGGSMRFSKLNADAPVVHVFGNDVAIVVAQHQVAGTSHTGAALPGRNTTSRIWVKRDGRWRVVLTSVTPIAGGAR
jgi:uncharacterized protein (TIGR02246 family)